MLDFPIGELMDEDACFDFLFSLLHPDGLSCPNQHQLPIDQCPHNRLRNPIYDYRCRTCGAVFNIFTGTMWSKTRFRCSTIVLILRGIAQGETTSQLARELGIDRTHLLDRRHQIQAVLLQQLGFSPLNSQ
jgi:transposase-like protein